MTAVLLVWICSAFLLIIMHLASALAIDRRIALGTWDKTALILLSSLGPLGLCLEVLLLRQVFADIRQQPQTRPKRRTRQHRWLFRAVLHMLPVRRVDGLKT